MEDPEFFLDNVPPLEELREERVRLLGQVRHHKDEQDAVTLDIEGHEMSPEVAELAARVDRLELFNRRAEAYVETELTQEVEDVIAKDQRQSEEDIAAFIQELQGHREQTLKRIATVQDRSAKAAVHLKASHEDPVDADQEKSIQHAVRNVEEGATLAEKVKKFRALKTKLQADIMRQKREGKQLEESMTARIKNTDLANARNARLCRELNSKNAALTTNVQLLLNQLNVEHYGINNAPSAKQIAEERLALQDTPDDTPAPSRGPASHKRGPAGSQGSRPPLVALKPTASQRSRDAASRTEREESASQLRPQVGGSVASEARSGRSSRRESLSRPPLPASKPAASQQSRDEAGSQAQRSRKNSHGSAARPASISAKSTGSQRN
ncbi:kinesin K39 [Strigomonas culicis]|uniref:Kinesin K39 n=1 Tax=Strigomonas culicis TaxID=28005 RepID=S9V2E1_9TRYP|nr:kinesin K39 [Strigomonas culicis]|eukprot:EPY37272.1 kinesin K39 [Strigomonas culicis]